MGAVAGIGKLAAAKAADQQAVIAGQIGTYNRDVYLRRSSTDQANAQYSGYLAQFAAGQAAYEADVNRRLGQLEYDWANAQLQRVAAAGKASADYTRAEGQAQATILDRQSTMLAEFGTEARRRMARQDRAEQGQTRVAIAASGAVESGSPLEVLTEQAHQAELVRLDHFVSQETTRAQLGYQRDLTLAQSEFQARGTEYQTELQVGDLKFRADASKYLSDFQANQTEMEGLIKYQEYKMQEVNYLAQAYDNQIASQIAMLESRSQATGYKAQAKALRWGAAGDILGSVFDFGTGFSAGFKKSTSF